MMSVYKNQSFCINCDVMEMGKNGYKCIENYVEKKSNGDTCLNLKGKKRCLNLNCPNGLVREEKTCKRKIGSPFFFNNKVIILPLNINGPLIIYALEKSLENLEIDFRILNNLNIDNTYFKLIDNKFLYELILIKSITKSEYFVIEINLYDRKEVFAKYFLNIYIV